MHAASYRSLPSGRSVLSAFLARLATDAPFWWRAAIVGIVTLAAFTALGLADPRLLDGAVVWEKPAKFMLSFVVHALTFAWAFALMPEAERRAPLNRRLSIAFVALFVFEVAYMTFRAAQGEASHFNTGTPVAAVLYGLMGLAALGLTAITAWFGWRLLRTRSDLQARAAATGLMLGALLGTAAGVYLSQGSGHWVGGAASDAGGLPFFRWSTSGGDLRVAHFLGLHTMQAIPLAAWLWPHPRTVWIAAVAMTLLTAAVFIQAVAGIPLFSA